MQRGQDVSAWRAQVERDLRGRAYEELWQELDHDARVPPLATQQDAALLPHLAPAPRSWLGADRPFAARELVVRPRPEDAARQAREALADGADEVELCWDEAARDALDPSLDGGGDAPPGLSGIAIHDLADFRAALEGVDLARAHIGLSAGESALPALAFLLCLADERSVPREALRGDVDYDPIARLTMRQAGVDEGDDVVVVARHTSVAHVFDGAAALVRACAKACPGIRPIAIDGQAFHLAGAAAATELAATLAALITTARELAERGCGFDALAAAATLRVQVSHEVLTEIAKLRALRLLWAKVAHAFGARDDASFRPLLQCVTSGRARAYQFDLRTNVLRTALAGFAATAGGCDALSVVPFDEDPAHQDDAARRLARHQLLLLRAEAHTDRVADPCGGSYAIERLTHELAAAAWRELQRIEAGGGLIEAMRDGSLRDTIETQAARRADAFASGDRVLVGITRYEDRALEGPPTGDANAFDATLAALAAAQRRTPEAPTGVAADQALDAAVAAARAGCGTASIARATWPERASFRHRFAPVAAPDGEEHEAQRADEAHESHEEKGTGDGGA